MRRWGQLSEHADEVKIVLDGRLLLDDVGAAAAAQYDAVAEQGIAKITKNAL